jgi:hypothetical protein
MLIIPALIFGALTTGSGIAVYKRSKRNKIVGMTPVRQKLFEALLWHQKEPKKLYKMADKFEKEGLLEQATKLRKLAAIYELPAEKKAERREIFKKAMASTNRDAVNNTAQLFDDDGCVGAAAALRKYASGLPPT